MRPPLTPADRDGGAGPRAGLEPRAAWSKALAGAAGVGLVLAVVPGMGLYLAIVVVPVVYGLGVPLAVHTFIASDDRWCHARRLIGGGACLGALVPVVPVVFRLLVVGRYDSVFAAQVLLCALAGAVVATIALLGATLTPTRRRAAVAAGGPIVLLVSAAVQVALWF
ncbi:MAG TPA: hypothetical protein VMM13_14445 [Euzebya sp.]|nr:hypothetical protein [Euzebya sp.]